MGQVVQAAPVKVGFIKHYFIELQSIFVRQCAASSIYALSLYAEGGPYRAQLEIWPRGTEIFRCTFISLDACLSCIRHQKVISIVPRSSSVCGYFMSTCLHSYRFPCKES